MSGSYINNNRGISMIYVFVAVVTIGGGLFIASQTSQMKKNLSSKSDSNIDLTLAINQMTDLLSDPVKCVSTFGTTASPTSISEEYYTLDSASAPAQGYGQTGFKILNYNLSTPTPNNGNITITFQNKKAKVDSASITRTINLYVVGTRGAITYCRAIPNLSDQIRLKGIGKTKNEPSALKQSCNEGSRGILRFASGEQKDTVEVCVKAAPNTYLWTELGEGGGGLGGLSACPSDMALVGDAGKHATYCINSKPHASDSYLEAVSICYSVNDAVGGRAHICDFNEWSTACAKGLASDMSGHTEWVAGSVNGENTIIGHSGCFSSVGAGSNNKHAFRCCIR